MMERGTLGNEASTNGKKGVMYILLRTECEDVR